MKFSVLTVLRIGLGITFLSNGIGAFIMPDSFHQLITNSLLYSHLLEIVPFYIYFIGYNDLVLCFLLINNILPKQTALWAAFWILGVISVFLFQGTIDGVLSALEHGTPLAIALYLSFQPEKSDLS